MAKQLLKLALVLAVLLPTPTFAAQSELWQQVYNNCVKTDLTKDMTGKQTDFFCSCLSRSVENVVQNNPTATKEQRVEKLKPMISECTNNALAIVDAPPAQAPAAANDCLNEQRQWQREETEALAMNQRAATSGIDLGQLNNPMGKLCPGLKMQAQMLRHKAAFFRKCHPDLQGEDTAHDADTSRALLEGQISSVCR